MAACGHSLETKAPDSFTSLSLILGFPPSKKESKESIHAQLAFVYKAEIHIRYVEATKHCNLQQWDKALEAIDEVLGEIDKNDIDVEMLCDFYLLKVGALLNKHEEFGLTAFSDLFVALSLVNKVEKLAIKSRQASLKKAFMPHVEKFQKLICKINMELALKHFPDVVRKYFPEVARKFLPEAPTPQKELTDLMMPQPVDPPPPSPLP